MTTNKHTEEDVPELPPLDDPEVEIETEPIEDDNPTEPLRILSAKEMTILRYGFLRSRRQMPFSYTEVYASSESLVHLVNLKLLQRIGVGLYQPTTYGLDIGAHAPSLINHIGETPAYHSWCITPVSASNIIGGDWFIPAERQHPARSVQGAMPFQIDRVTWFQWGVYAEVFWMTRQGQTTNHTLYWEPGTPALKVSLS